VPGACTKPPAEFGPILMKRSAVASKLDAWPSPFGVGFAAAHGHAFPSLITREPDFPQTWGWSRSRASDAS
jgi:hypothetical protein